jgi:hypothetical protein
MAELPEVGIDRNNHNPDRSLIRSDRNNPDRSLIRNNRLIHNPDRSLIRNNRLIRNDRLIRNNPDHRHRQQVWEGAPRH